MDGWMPNVLDVAVNVDRENLRSPSGQRSKNSRTRRTVGPWRGRLRWEDHAEAMGCPVRDRRGLICLLPDQEATAPVGPVLL
jgi:hypothetical protein